MLAGIRRKPTAANHAKFTFGLVTKSVMIVTTTVAATGMVVTAAESTRTIFTATPVHAWIQIINTRTISVSELAQFISGRVMATVTMGITCAVATGTVEIAADTPKMERNCSMLIAKSASAATRM